MKPWQNRFDGLILVNLCLFRFSDVFQKLGTSAFARQVLCLAFAFHIRVLLGEERWLARTHGAQWEHY